MGLLDFLTQQDRSGRAQTAAALYADAVAQARQPSFYVALAVPDTLEGRFELITLHVHLLCRRIGTLGEKGASLAQALFDTMFRDMDRNLRELGVGDPSLPRRIKAMLEAYYGRIKAYEAALAAGGDALAKAIARNVYNDEAAPGAGPLARYALAAVDRLDAASPAELVAGRAPFPPAPGA